MSNGGHCQQTARWLLAMVGLLLAGVAWSIFALLQSVDASARLVLWVTAGTQTLALLVGLLLWYRNRSAAPEQRESGARHALNRMQALSENSPDLIARVENNAISYINPVIESYTGKSIAQFLHKSMQDAELDPAVTEQWLQVVQQVSETHEKVSTEMGFPSAAGPRIMQVDAIPEYDGNRNLESVLVVSHDITDRRQVEQEAEQKSQKVADSINYARRIQRSLLPSNRLLTRNLPDSFVLYKPRDVVSGDFPWFAQANGHVYVAAVDCTGHGVPGALLSVIGFFLLNDIVRSRQVSDPGRILDLLDQGVTESLRQDSDDGASRDGMDISICRINPTTREVTYAGAHRPLYLIRSGELEEVKGDRYSIGGGIFRNQSVFSSRTYTLDPGDSIFICSDGFSDQFGGPENRKLGSRRLRELLQQCAGQTMREALQTLDGTWEQWRGAARQTDDVLLIGIKL